MDINTRDALLELIKEVNKGRVVSYYANSDVEPIRKLIKRGYVVSFRGEDSGDIEITIYIPNTGQVGLIHATAFEMSTDETGGARVVENALNKLLEDA